ncbi:uncharacterized protein LOC142021256 [Carettochelys insculpta]|uniref:uncharacterized protein LOC142021256 n=1 Tax=Carettochelys insculpta TaxID=44489 RepID=UPI003EB6EBE8
MLRLWIMGLALLGVPVMAVTQLPGNAQCPVNCSCFFSQWFVQCANASLVSRPLGIPSATVELDLQHNQFSTLSAGFFPELPEVSTISLGSCGIRQVEPGAFIGVKNLFHLHLENNLLEQLPEGIFENLTNLIFLHLEHNQIANLLPGTFSSLKQLSVLDLSNNLLLELSDQALQGLPLLRRLYLSGNRISNMSSKALPGNLRALRLDWNQLVSVPAAVRASPMLATLQLSGNPIRKLTSLSFGRRLRSLSQLYLDSLALEQVTALAFTRLRRLELLSLRNNSLESLPSLSSLKSLSRLYLTGNRWRCDCSLIWLRTWQKRVLRKERSPVMCSSPQALQGRLLVNLELQKLTCPPYGMDSTTLSLPENTNTPMATAPSRDKPLARISTTAATTTSAALITTRSSASSTTFHHHVLERWDPCLADHISRVSIRTKGATSLVVSWSFSGDHDQFEVRYTAGRDEQVLRVMGRLAEVTLHDLRPGTEYRVCVIPQNENLLECQIPGTGQCSAEHTASLPSSAQPVHNQLGHSHSAVGIGVAAALLTLVALALVVTYRLRTRPIQFQRYYDEDGSLPHRRSSNRAKLPMHSVDQDMEDEHRQSHMTAASHCPEKVNCTVSTPPRSTSTPTYIAL